MQVRGPGRPVRQPLYLHPPNTVAKRPVVPALDAAARYPVSTHDRGTALLTDRPHIDMILGQLPHRLPRPPGQPFLQLSMNDLGTFLIGQLRHHRIEHHAGPLEPRNFIRVPWHRAPSSRCGSSAIQQRSEKEPFSRETDTRTHPGRYPAPKREPHPKLNG